MALCILEVLAHENVRDFTCLKRLLEFVGVGEPGLLGYKSWELHGSESIQIQYNEQIAALRVESLHLKSEIESQRVSLQDVPAFVQKIE